MKSVFLRLFQTARTVWHSIQRGAPAWAEPKLLPALHQMKDAVRLLLKPTLVTRHFHESGDGDGPKAIGVGLTSFGGLLPRVLTQWPTERSGNEASFWRIRTIGLGESVDLVAVEGPLLLTKALPRRNTLMLPRCVWHTLEVTGAWEDVCRRFHQSIRKNELRLIRKHGYRFEMSRDAGHFEHFFERMYLPTVRSRHRGAAMPTNRAKAREFFEHGFLVRVLKDGTWIAGALCEERANGLQFCLVGLSGSGENLLRQGAMAATYLGVIYWANRLGFRRVHFSASKPFLGDGILQHKRKWGTSISLPVEDQFRIWIRIRRYTPEIHRLLTSNPMITVDNGGRLHGLVSLNCLDDWTKAQAIQWRRRFNMPGLTTIRVLPMDRFRETGVLSLVTVEAP